MDNIKLFFKDLDNIKATFNFMKTIEYPFPTNPNEFIEYAEKDLETDSPRSWSNSLANTKRALDSQLDYFFMSYNLSNLLSVEKWSTGKKIRLIGDLGIVPSRILHAVNEQRNKLEHNYKPPDFQTAANALDIVGLFIAATDMYLFPFHDEIDFINSVTNESVAIDLQVENKIRVWFTQEADDAIIVDPLFQKDESFYFLIFFLNYRKFLTNNCSNYFKKLKYIKSGLNLPAN